MFPQLLGQYHCYYNYTQGENIHERHINTHNRHVLTLISFYAFLDLSNFRCNFIEKSYNSVLASLYYITHAIYCHSAGHHSSGEKAIEKKE